MGSFNESVNSVTVKKAVIKLGNNFSIRLRFEFITFTNQIIFQVNIVFNNTVMHKGNNTIHRFMWVSICFVRYTVGCPTGMTNTNCALRFFFLNFCLQILYSAFFFDYRNIIVTYRNTCRVISAVFKSA